VDRYLRDSKVDTSRGSEVDAGRWCGGSGGKVNTGRGGEVEAGGDEVTTGWWYGGRGGEVGACGEAVDVGDGKVRARPTWAAARLVGARQARGEREGAVGAATRGGGEDVSVRKCGKRKEIKGDPHGERKRPGQARSARGVHVKLFCVVAFKVSERHQYV
jgi:hypothetical protein